MQIMVPVSHGKVLFPYQASPLGLHGFLPSNEYIEEYQNGENNSFRVGYWTQSEGEALAVSMLVMLPCTSASGNQHPEIMLFVQVHVLGQAVQIPPYPKKPSSHKQSQMSFPPKSPNIKAHK